MTIYIDILGAWGKKIEKVGTNKGKKREGQNKNLGEEKLKFLIFPHKSSNFDNFPHFQNCKIFCKMLKSVTEF